MEKRAKLTLKERQRQEREQFILQTAENVLMKKGYHHTSMDEIAANAGIAKGTLYLHFKSKDELVFALVEPKLYSFLNTVEEAKAYHGSSKEKLVFLIKKEMSGAFFQFVMKSYPDMASVFQGERGVQIQKVLSNIISGIIEIHEEGKAAKIFDSAIPTEMMANLFMNIFDPHVYSESVKNGKVSKDDFIRYVIKMYFQGIEK
ncbi:TetR/AcrR family transcriptional regulator [Desmospora activa]|uniref:TetR family transcriptional regulator n=1 Tax=Desmospora activa DSM 45169 TaxID=1121389 RepID=A0A2T4Z0S2_9BACL|nr:TetR/AcrR family transcriptional regulator [Desmospora activa]PTM53322.1 TetR family transcriptional regulator [Desmospora activa DSM 45169]